jgi:hypothetical protein
MNAYCASRISEHMARDGAGQLLCLSVPIAREGQQEYKASEIGIANSDDLVTVMRPASEVFSRAAMASFEGLPLTDDHPPRLIGPENWANYSRGHIQNVREGPRLPSGDRCLIADLVVSDANLISKIQAGKRDVSCGYQCDYFQLSDGTWAQCNLRGNHVSVVHSGRALNTKIHDSKETGDDMTEEERKQVRELTAAITRLTAIMKDEHSQTSADRRRQNSAGEMLRDAKRIEEYLRTAPGPAELDRFIRGGPQTTSEELRQSNLRRADEFSEQARAAGIAAQNRWGYQVKDCRPSLRRVPDNATPAQDFEDATRARRKQLLGR